jgi:aspartate aminotransferase
MSPPSSTHNNTTSQSRASDRLNSIKNQIMASSSIPTVFGADIVPQAPEDPLFGLMAAYKKDGFEKKVDLGIGAYRDNNAKPWVLPVVKKVCKRSILEVIRSI